MLYRANNAIYQDKDRFAQLTPPKGAKTEVITPEQILLSSQKTNIAAGGIFNTRESKRALKKSQTASILSL